MKALIVFLGCSASLAVAQGLKDPTRPPAELGLPVAAGSDIGIPAEPRASRLESVLVGRGFTGREVAVIDGKVVRRGETYNGAVLVRVGPNEAVLKRGGKEEVLRLFPAVIEGKRSQARRASE